MFESRGLSTLLDPPKIDALPKKTALVAWDICNANANPFITEENAWAITARKKLKEEDKLK